MLDKGFGKEQHKTTGDHFKCEISGRANKSRKNKAKWTYLVKQGEIGNGAIVGSALEGVLLKLFPEIIRTRLKTEKVKSYSTKERWVFKRLARRKFWKNGKTTSLVCSQFGEFNHTCLTLREKE